MAQFEAHQLSIPAFPCHNPAALQPLVELVTGGWVDAWGACVEAWGACVGAWVACVDVGSVAGRVPSLGKIRISAQLTNVSCNPRPSPHPVSSQPHEFPSFHHHCITQWSQTRPFGSLRSTLNTFLPNGRFHLVPPFTSSKRCVNLACVIGAVPMLPTRNSKKPLWFAVIFILAVKVWPSVKVFVMTPLAYFPGCTYSGALDFGWSPHTPHLKSSNLCCRWFQNCYILRYSKF